MPTLFVFGALRRCSPIDFLRLTHEAEQAIHRPGSNTGFCCVWSVFFTSPGERVLWSAHFETFRPTPACEPFLLGQTLDLRSFGQAPCHVKVNRLQRCNRRVWPATSQEISHESDRAGSELVPLGMRQLRLASPLSF